MLQINKILFPTDFSEFADRALPYAARFASRYDAELHMLHALVLHAADPGDPRHRFPQAEELYALIEESIEARLSAAAEQHAAGELELKVEQVQRRGISAAPVILDYATEQDVDLIVLGTHGRRGLRHLLVGSVAEEVVRLAPCPVLTVRREGKDGDGAPARIERIVVPVDFSRHSRLALAYAADIAASYGARLHLVHVIEDVVYPDFYMPVAEARTRDDLEERALERLSALLGEVTSGTEGVPGHVHALTGRAPSRIAEFAEEEDADLIVIATHGLTGLEHVLLGSVTERLVRRAPCPVLTVKAFGKNLLTGRARG